MAIATIEGRKFWNICTHDVTNIARHKDFRRQFKYEQEKTKNGQITPSPQAGATSECSTAQINADMTASKICRLVINVNIQSPPAMSNVSIGGPIMTRPMNKPIAGPSNSGPAF